MIILWQPEPEVVRCIKVNIQKLIKVNVYRICQMCNLYEVLCNYFGFGNDDIKG